MLKPKPVYPQQDYPKLLSKPRFTPIFIVTYNPHNPPLRKWIQDIHFILLADKKMAKVFPAPPSVSYRQARNLKQILVRSTLKELPFNDVSDQSIPGYYKHKNGGRGRNCMLCPRLKEGRDFRSNFTGLCYRLGYSMTCKSTYCVYPVTFDKVCY